MNNLITLMDDRLDERLKYVDDMNAKVNQKFKKHEIVMLLGQSEIQQLKKQQEFQFSLWRDQLLSDQLIDTGNLGPK